MASAALTRLESLLSARKLDATIARDRTPAGQAMSTGVPTLDRVLEGGWRRGEVSEVIGGPSSGRTGILVSTLAAATSRGAMVGLVDAFDRFDPVTAAAAGLDLDRVLWVRGPALTLEQARSALVDEAVHRAVRALDLIVRAGGFAVAALDLAGVSPRYLKALPSATWMRLAHANEGQPTACVLVADAPVGRSARGVSVHLQASGCWTGNSPQSGRLAGFEIQARLEQARRTGPAPQPWKLRVAG